MATIKHSSGSLSFQFLFFFFFRRSASDVLRGLGPIQEQADGRSEMLAACAAAAATVQIHRDETAVQRVWLFRLRQRSRSGKEGGCTGPFMRLLEKRGKEVSSRQRNECLLVDSYILGI